MAPADSPPSTISAPAAAEPPAPAGRIAGRCDHCGRPVRSTQHTRNGYAVDYYSLHSGHGDVAAFSGDDRTRGTYVKLRDRFDVITCADCYRRGPVQVERERRFHPERDDADDADDASET